MRQSELLKSYATKLRLYNLNSYMDDIVHKAQEDRPSYLDFLLQVLEKEVVSRERKDYERRLSAAHL